MPTPPSSLSPFPIAAHRVWGIVTLTLSCCLGVMVAPAAIFVSQEDLADLDLGADLWRVTYQLEGPALTAGQGFTVYFDDALYRNITLDLAPAGWDVRVVQPDRALPDDGFLDALKLGVDLVHSGPFQLTLEWLGSGVPHMQPFELYNLEGQFEILDYGMTAVPEPAETAVVFGLGLVAAGWWIRRRRVTPPTL